MKKEIIKEQQEVLEEIKNLKTSDFQQIGSNGFKILDWWAVRDKIRKWQKKLIVWE